VNVRSIAAYRRTQMSSLQLGLRVGGHLRWQTFVQMTQCELSHMSGAIDDSTINIVLGISIISITYLLAYLIVMYWLAERCGTGNTSRPVGHHWESSGASSAAQVGLWHGDNATAFSRGNFGADRDGVTVGGEDSWTSKQTCIWSHQQNSLGGSYVCLCELIQGDWVAVLGWQRGHRPPVLSQSLPTFVAALTWVTLPLKFRATDELDVPTLSLKFVHAVINHILFQRLGDLLFSRSFTDSFSLENTWIRPYWFLWKHTPDPCHGARLRRFSKPEKSWTPVGSIRGPGQVTGQILCSLCR